MFYTFLLAQVVTVQPELFEAPAATVCYTESRSAISTDHFLILRNRNVPGLSLGFRHDIKISGEMIQLTFKTAAGLKSYRINGSYFFDKNTNLDVDVFPAIYKNNLHLFWEETTKYNGRRFGLVGLNSGNVISVCKGLTEPIAQH